MNKLILTLTNHTEVLEREESWLFVNGYKKESRAIGKSIWEISEGLALLARTTEKSDAWYTLAYALTKYITEMYELVSIIKSSHKNI